MANMTTQEILQGIKDWAAPKVIYDISAAHNNTKYTDLADALGTNGGNIPQEYRKGGITVRFVCTYDNNYVQYRLMADDFSTTVSDWQGVDDIPTAGSENLVKSGGVNKGIAELGFFPKKSLSPSAFANGWFLTGNGLSAQSSLYQLVKYAVTSGTVLKLNIAKDTTGVMQFQSAANVPSSGTNANLIGSPYKSAVDGLVKVPSGATYLIVSQSVENTTNYVEVRREHDYETLDITDSTSQALKKSTLTLALTDEQGFNKPVSISSATKEKAGVMSGYDKAKMVGIDYSNLLYNDVHLNKFEEILNGYWDGSRTWGGTATHKSVYIPIVQSLDYYIKLNNTQCTTAWLLDDSKEPIGASALAYYSSEDISINSDITAGASYIAIALTNANYTSGAPNIIVSTEGISKHIEADKVWHGINLISTYNSYKGQYSESRGWEGNYGGSSAKWYISDYIDVTNLDILKILARKGDSRHTSILAYNENKEIVSSNSINNVINGNYIVWFKEQGTRYIRVSYNLDYDFYCYAAVDYNSLKSLKAYQTYDERNLLSVYNLINQRGLNYDGTDVNLGGASDGYKITDYIDVRHISKLRVKGYAYETTDGYLNLAAYDSSKTFIAANSVRGQDSREYIWEKQEGTTYIRIGFRTVSNDYYCYNYPLVSDTVTKEDINNVFTVGSPITVQLNDKVDSVLKLQQANGGSTKPLTLLHFSDIHGNKKALERLIDFKNFYSSYIDEVLNTGDTVADKYSNGVEWYFAVNGAENILNIIGNHDTAGKSGSTYNWYDYVGVDAYNRYLAPCIANWGVIQPENAATNGYCYYYKDYATQNLRLVFLDVMGYNNTQNTWLEGVLSDAKTNSMSVVVVLHNTPAGLTPVSCGFTSVISPWDGANWSDSVDIWTTVQDFIDAGGKFMCYVGGHTHFDNISIGENYPKQLAIHVGTSGINPTDKNKVEGTKSQDDFNIISFDTVNNIIKIIKVGCDYNIAMQHADVLGVLIDYNSTEKYTFIK